MQYWSVSQYLLSDEEMAILEFLGGSYSALVTHTQCDMPFHQIADFPIQDLIAPTLGVVHLIECYTIFTFIVAHALTAFRWYSNSLAIDA